MRRVALVPVSLVFAEIRVEFALLVTWQIRRVVSRFSIAFPSNNKKKYAANVRHLAPVGRTLITGRWRKGGGASKAQTGKGYFELQFGSENGHLRAD